MKSKLNKKHAISLIVLVVTILVVAIIAAAVIISLNNTNMMGETSKTVFKQDMANYKEAYELYATNKLAANASFDRNTLNVTYASNPTEFKEIFGDKVPDKYKTRLKVVNGKLIYDTEDDTEKSVLKDLAIPFMISALNVNLNGYETGEWTNEDIVVTLTSDVLENEKYQYKISTGNWTDCEGTITINTDQETVYYFRVLNSSDTVESTSEGYEIKRDTVAPTFTLTSSASGNFREWTIINVSDVGGGMADNFQVTVSYKLATADDSAYQVAYTGTQTSGTIDVESWSSYIVKAQIKDKAGNVGVNTSTTGTGCFVAGTKVLTEDGLRNIEEIVEGDKVYTINLDNNARELKDVTFVYRGYSDEIYEITVGNEVIKATPRHQFYVVDKGWIRAYELKVGDKFTMNGIDGNMTIEKIELVSYDEPIPVYNLTVESNHNYLITVSELLVHNAGAFVGSPIASEYGSSTLP